jgi:hypothetical protein
VVWFSNLREACLAAEKEASRRGYDMQTGMA